MNELFSISDALKDILDKIAPIAKSLGRFVTKQILCLYYVLKDGELSDMEKISIYAAIVYVIAPKDLVPRKVFKFLGITDDALALVYVVGKVKGKITPEIMEKVNLQLDLWFGSENEGDEVSVSDMVRDEIAQFETAQSVNPEPETL